MGGMAAFIPSRRDEAVNARALEAVHADKRREAQAGFDGTWVAHPDLVAIALGEFDEVLQGRPNQLDRQRDDVVASAAALVEHVRDGLGVDADELDAHGDLLHLLPSTAAGN